MVNEVQAGKKVLRALPAWLQADDGQIDQYVKDNVTDLASAKLALAENAKATAALARVVLAMAKRLR